MAEKLSSKEQMAYATWLVRGAERDGLVEYLSVFEMYPDYLDYPEEPDVADISDEDARAVHDLINTAFVIIPKAEYDSLVDDANTLRKLEHAGVDNWEWYSDAIHRPQDFE